MSTVCDIQLSADFLPKGCPTKPKTIGEHLKTYRLIMGLSARQVAKSLDVFVDTVYKWEYGDTKPKIENIKNIIEYMGYDPRENYSTKIKDHEYTKK